jgi:hypothetical protein
MANQISENSINTEFKIIFQHPIAHNLLENATNSPILCTTCLSLTYPRDQKYLQITLHIVINMVIIMCLEPHFIKRSIVCKKESVTFSKKNLRLGFS